jgi:hypothetical protein
MDKKTTVPINIGDCKGSITDILDRIKYSNKHGVLLVDYSVSDEEVELTFRYPD